MQPKRSGAAAPDARRGGVGSALRVSENGRYLIRPDGKPFFWLGDTAWLLFQMTTREDADLYLKTRARQGFTVIQAALVMGEERVGGTLRPNRYGDLAFEDGNSSRPALKPEGRDYWNHADYIVERAGSYRLTLGLLPLFVGYGGDGYKYLTPDNASGYGQFLGRRYRDKGHVFWILGGDNTPDTEAKRQVWERMARGIALGISGVEDYRNTLMTYHINGGASSSQWFHRAPWLDFNMTQVWGNERGIYPAVAQDYGLAPAKPAGLGEGSYEDGPQYPTKPVDALKVRQQAYWSYLAGGYHTYGNTNVWNFGTYKPEAAQDWKGALRSPGAESLSVLARLLPALEWWKLVPDPSIISDGGGSGDQHIAAAAMRSAQGDRLLVYLPGPGTVSLRLDKITASTVARATWMDPRTGARTAAAGELPTVAKVPHAFTTPPGWPDALLLVEARSGR